MPDYLSIPAKKNVNGSSGLYETIFPILELTTKDSFLLIKKKEKKLFFFRC